MVNCWSTLFYQLVGLQGWSFHQVGLWRFQAIWDWFLDISSNLGLVFDHFKQIGSDFLSFCTTQNAFLVLKNLGGWYPPREKLKGGCPTPASVRRREPLPRRASKPRTFLYPILTLLRENKLELYTDIETLHSSFLTPLGPVSHGASAGYQELRRKLTHGLTGKSRKREYEDRDCKKFSK